ncbi:hypothetical protein K469DRAFT_757345 [Zopfia rhizophila CBS 207.26]|uniref:Uncharacterized protein n=1 Tax=Zopfia rhizophila CBS 207.26 TaxID=1314779 RepID=A0A6A6EW23_9PEZI|nr:hypothetical protein K469DRAFT_757345 [Zopfia rhizophila CBS 207.26]
MAGLRLLLNCFTALLQFLYRCGFGVAESASSHDQFHKVFPGALMCYQSSPRARETLYQAPEDVRKEINGDIPKGKKDKGDPRMKSLVSDNEDTFLGAESNSSFTLDNFNIQSQEQEGRGVVVAAQEGEGMERPGELEVWLRASVTCPIALVKEAGAGIGMSDSVTKEKEGGLQEPGQTNTLEPFIIELVMLCLPGILLKVGTADIKGLTDFGVQLSVTRPIALDEYVGDVPLGAVPAQEVVGGAEKPDVGAAGIDTGRQPLTMAGDPDPAVGATD